jgi:hypothetical protein
MGLLDNFNFDDPATMGLLSAGLNMLGNSGRGGNMNTGQILAVGAGAGMQGAQNVLQARAQAELMKRKMLMEDLQNQHLQMGVDAQKQTLADQQEQRKALMGYAQKSMDSRQQAQGQDSASMQSQGAPQSAGQSFPQAQSLPAQISKGSILGSQIKSEIDKANYYETLGTPASYNLAQAARAQAAKYAEQMPKFANEYRVGMDKDGKPINVRLADDGSEQYSNTGFAEKLHYGDNGQQLLGIGEYTGKVKSANQKFQTLESLASNAVTMRGQNLTDSRAKELNSITRQGNQTQVINDPVRGIMLVDKGTGKVSIGNGSDGQPMQTEMAAKKENSANTIMPIISDAKELIKNATGSYGGMAFDKAAQFFGGATGGAESIAKLRVLEGQLMMSQPRMEGPQSDKDVSLYRQMAGQIGDPAVPARIKAAALDEIEKITSRYSKGYKEPSSKNPIDSLLDKYK